MNGRVYDYNLGRFLSVDPLIHMEGGSQGINPYSYIMNNPLSGTDPTGYAPEDEVKKTVTVTKTGSRIKHKVEVSASSNGSGGATVTFSGSNGAAVSAVKNSVSSSLSGAGYSVADIGSQGEIAKGTGNSPNARDMASVSDHVYGKEGATLPDHISQVTGDQLEELGLGDMVMNDPDSGFKSGLYYDSNSEKYIYAFAGTENGTDWGENFAQGLGRFSEQYDRAIRNTQTIRDATNGALHLTGHSLGGGLASAASLVSNVRATTFNAARVNPSTMLRYNTRMTNANTLINAYYVRGEILNSLQSAAGNRIPLSPANPMKWWYSPAYRAYRSYELHGMNEVLASPDL